MQIDERHHLAAKALASGATEAAAAEAATVSVPTVARWKRDGEFRALILRYSDPLRKAARTAADPATADLYELIPERESAALSKLEAVTATLGEVLVARLDSLSPDEVRDIPVRMLPSLIKAFVEGFRHIQESHDRLSGYGLILDEMAKLRDETLES